MLVKKHHTLYYVVRYYLKQMIQKHKIKDMQSNEIKSESRGTQKVFEGLNSE